MGLFDFLFGKKGGGTSAAGAPRRGLKRANVEKRFELSGQGGPGSMSKVYRAYDRELGRTVCLKIMDKVKTQKFEARFKGLKKPSEGEVVMALRHDNIVRGFEHGVTTNGEPYLVMEWVQGNGLNVLIDTRSPQVTGHRLALMSQLCDAVQYLHDNKWLHRDLCPRNMMVDADGVLKLIDFGLTVPYTPVFTGGGNRTGTADILAPELIKRKPTDHRVDLFALGVTAFEMYTGQLPWERSPSSEETFRRRLNTPPRDPRDLNPKVDDALATVLLKSVGKEPHERYPTAAAFKEALERVGEPGY